MAPPSLCRGGGADLQAGRPCVTSQPGPSPPRPPSSVRVRKVEATRLVPRTDSNPANSEPLRGCRGRGRPCFGWCTRRIWAGLPTSRARWDRPYPSGIERVCGVCGCGEEFAHCSRRHLLGLTGRCTRKQCQVGLAGLLAPAGPVLPVRPQNQQRRRAGSCCCQLVFCMHVCRHAFDV
ncbi:hypothetical protein BC567DRAFT_83112 [Phyllosticta citribraziliensis]